ncbi:MAG TPA: META domain-containing protein [Jatrophihabitantaceae bacterium]|nr:META domain-containing protein [Jatrophihabitantaceae bacterium]
MTDDELDARLSAAGARWRERNTESAGVDPAAFTAWGNLAADKAADNAGETAGGNVGGPDTTDQQPLPLIPDPQPKPRRSRRARVLLAASAAVAAAVVASVLAVQLGGGSSGGNHVAAQGGTPLTGTDWQLTATSKAGAATGVNATLHLTGSGELSGSDGCNAFGGHVSMSADQLTLGRVVHTMMGCLGANGTVGQAVDAVLSGGPVQYAINGDTLTITKSGTGTLTYTATHLRATPATTDPAALTGTAWRLDTVQLGDNVDQPYGTASSAPPGAQIQFTQTELTGNDGCNAFSGKVELGAGTINVPSDLATTLKQCATSTSDWTLVLKGATRWEISGDQLTITDAHNGKLVFTRDIDPGFSGASGTASPSGTPTTTASK